MYVTKRNGEKQLLDLNKIHAVLTWACNGENDNLSQIKGVSISQIEMNARLHFYDDMPTKKIHEILIMAASGLISEDFPNYDQVAARLVWFSVRKEAFKSNIPPDLFTVITKNIWRGVYTKEILSFYTKDEIDHINGFIVHKRDDLFKYAGAEQMRKKYLVQNRKTKQVYESFQFPYILVSMLLFAKYPATTRMKYIKKYYDLISQHDISLPTPIMAGLRTNIKQFSSCTLIESGDSLKSINAAASAIVDYASRKAGIGLSIGAIRAEGQIIRGGDAVTTGVLPFAKYFNAALKSCSQGAVRGASATFNYPIWHLELERLIELKNNKGTEETRLRTVDYCVHLNKLFYERLVNKGNITLFSPEEVPDLYRAFYSDNYKEFERLYKIYEKDSSKTKRVLNAESVFTKLIQERYETGRIYILNADLVNKHSSFYEPIKMTNLCTEITLPTVEMGNDKSLIALCTLSAINLGKFVPFGEIEESSLYQKQESRLREVCEMAVRGLDALLDYQDYPLIEAERHSMRYRPLGIGVIGFAHWLAKGKLLWGEKHTLEEVEVLAEKLSYYLIEASIKLAKEFGALEVKTKYSDGIFPCDTSPVKVNTVMNWDYLRDLVKKSGIRNATLMAFMPSETSSQLANETNGIDPPKDLVSIKGSKDAVLPQIVPEYAKYGPFYQKLWDIDTKDYLKTIAVFQKYVDQAISVNTSYNPNKKQISIGLLLSDLMYAYKLGHKTLYYNNVNDGSGESTSGDDCDSGACKI
jgi:ribonucleoside-diphosphate reductase alpha chain